VSRLFARVGRGAPRQRERDPQAEVVPVSGGRARRARFRCMEDRMRRLVLAALLTTSFLSTACLAPAARAQSAPDATPPDATTAIPETVVTATRVPTGVENVPAGVTVITRKTIDQRGYTSLVQALSAVPGVRVVQSGGPGGNASVFIRGTNGNHALVLLDGTPINDPSIANDAFNFGVDTLSDVERIEVVRGPMSGLYGSGAVGGVINIITRHGKGTPRASLSLAGGTQDTLLGGASLSGSSGKFDYALSYGGESTSGFDALARRLAAYTGRGDGYRNDTGTIDLGYTPVQGTRLSLLLRGRYVKYAYPDVGFPAFDDRNEMGQDTSLFGRVGVRSRLFDGRLTTRLYLSRLQDDRRYTNLLDANDPNQAMEDSRYHGYRTALQWNNTLLLPDAGPARFTSLTFGYDHSLDSAKVRLNSITGGFVYRQNLDASASSDAGHAGIQTTLFHRLTLSGNLREEAVQNVGSAFTWRLGANLALPEIASHLKFAYGTAFRAPSLFDRYGIDSSGYVGNPNLKPEHSRGWEVGITTDLPAFGRRRFASVSVTYFHNRISNLIVTQFAPVFTAVNVGAARTQGVETALTLRPASWLSIDAAYTYTDARDLSTGSLLLRRPENQASIDVRATPLPGLTIAPEVLYTGGSEDFLVDNAGFPAGTGLTEPGTIVNLTVSYRLTPKITIFANGNNLFYSRFEPASGYATPGQSFLFGIRAAL